MSCAVAVLLSFRGSATPAAVPPYDPANDIILVWNQVMLDANAGDSRLLIPDQGGPTRTSRAFAIVSVAMFDAWNSVTHRYDPYLSELSGYNSADQTAAVSTAARDTLIAMFPQQTRKFRLAWTTALQPIPENAISRIYLGIHWSFDATEGVASGRRIADEVYSSALLPKPRR